MKRESLECEIGNVEDEIERLEKELPYNPDREVLETWIVRAGPGQAQEV